MTSTSTRPRSLGGCATCRSRHIKCDETKPNCLVCKRASLPCAGYENRLSFDHDDLDANANRRRPLYSEAQRKCMAEELIASVPFNGVDKLLVLLERECDRNERARLSEFSVSRGPFTVFNANVHNLDFDEPVLQEDTLSSETHGEGQDLPEVDLIEFSPFETVDNIVDMWNPLVHDAEFLDEQASDSTVLCHTSFQPSSLLSDSASLSESFEVSDFPSFLTPLLNEQTIPKDAICLLQHFNKSVIRILSPPQYQKSPWHILFSPSVMNTLGALTMGMHISDTQLSIFYSILSISSYSLRRSGAHDRRFWESRGADFQTKAHEHLKSMLGSLSLCSAKKVAKYKDILMALLGLVTASVFGGHAKHAESCLLDAERVIRYKGLTKARKSRKARLLHHLYTYLRMMHESTRGAVELTGRQKLISNPSRPGKNQSSTEPYFRLDLSLSRFDQTFLMTEKEAWLGEQDLHLAVPGRWERTLYPEIFGIPESWMQLLSQCIRLGNEVDVAKISPEMSTLGLAEFMERAKDLENCLIQWDPRSRVDWHFDNDTSSGPHDVSDTDKAVDNLKAALHQALLIYFFRRVRDVSALLLQDRVLQTLLILNRHNNTGIDDQYTSTFLWPGFIAACEALDPSVQVSFSRWFESCADRSGLESFSEARKVAQRVWVERGKAKSPNFSWREVLSNADGMKLFYS